MKFLSTLLLVLFFYFLFKAVRVMFVFWRRYGAMIKQFRDVQRGGQSGFGGFGGTTGFTGTGNAGASDGQQSRRKSTADKVTGGGTQKKKIIPKDEGEYVDFEEI